MWLFNKVLGCRRFEKREREIDWRGTKERQRQREWFFFDLNILSHTLFIPEENFPHIEHDVQLYLSRYCLLFILTCTLSSPSRFISMLPFCSNSVGIKVFLSFHTLRNLFAINRKIIHLFICVTWNVYNSWIFLLCY